MGKVDCVAEACRKSFDEGKNEVIRKLLVNSDLSVEEISRLSGVSLVFENRIFAKPITLYCMNFIIIK